MEVVIEYNQNWSYEKIYHISDIHIRNTESHKEEYLHVFNNLYEYLNQVKDDKSMIVITGDILHNKDRLTPLCIELCYDFLTSLSKIMLVVFIAGNHDINIRNIENHDGLQSIFYKRKNKNLYYLRESKVYRFNNILFGVSSLHDNNILSANEIDYEGIKIGLYHGIISNSKNSIGFEFSDKSITQFDGYDLVLLGDIHYHQYLNEEKTIAYAGSLISQNFGETDENHGVLVWNLKDRTSYYKIIDNDYRYVDITIKDSKIYYRDNEISVDDLILGNRSRLRINMYDSDTKTYNLIVKSIEKKYPLISIKHNKLLTVNKVEQNEVILQNESLEAIINNELLNVDSEIRDEVKNILFMKLDKEFKNINEKSNWKLLSLEFSNLLTYGANNKIDFTKLNFDEITGLIGSNSSGKSSLIDILLFTLYGKYSRNFIDMSNRSGSISAVIINNNCDKFDCKVLFEVNNIIYEINKSGKRFIKKKEHLYDTINYTNYKLYKYENSDKIDLSEFSNNDTQEKINKLIGTYDGFCLSSVCLQNNSKIKYDFYDMTPKARKEFLNNLLDLDIFECIETEYKELLKNNKTKIFSNQKLLNYLNYNDNALDIMLELKKNIDSYNITNDEEVLKEYKKELNEIIKNRSPIPKKFEGITKSELNLLLDKFNINTNIDNIEKVNDDLLRNIKQTTINKSNYDEKNLLHIKNKIIELKLINNKDAIISNNKIYEFNKNNKLIDLKSKINSKYKKMDKIFDDKIINNLQYFYDELNIPNYTDNINNLKSQLNDIKTTYTSIKTKADNIYKLIDFKINIKDNIKQKYKNINYKLYIKDIDIKLSNYELIKQTYLIAETYKDIINMFEKFNTNINHKCQNCINHSKDINQFYCKNNLHYENVKQQYEYLTNLQNEKIQLYNYHLIKQYNKYLSYLDLYELIMKDIFNNIKYYEQLEIINYQNAKNKLSILIEKINNSNLLFQIETLERSNNDEYNMLLNELELYNKYNTQLENYNNYIHNLEIYKKIEENKQLLADFNEKELIKETINNITNNEINEEIYYSLCQNIEMLTEKINIKKNTHLENIKQYNILNEKYIQYTNIINDNLCLEKEQNILMKIIELTGIEGIPRKIINIKLSHVQNDINILLQPFLNKKIIIKAETNENSKLKKKNIDIHVFFDDNKNKTNLLGGFESFLISLAFKITLTNFFNVPYCGLLIVDEGTSVLDKNNVDKFHIIADFIKNYYNHIILISHIPSFNDYIDQFINIDKNKDKTSKLMF
jgi:hypothetical protein